MSNKIKPDLAMASMEQRMTGLRAVEAAMSDVYKDIVAAPTPNILPEDVFVEYFLDFFMHREKYAKSHLLSKWIEIAGGPYLGVALTNKAGRVVATTPGAMLNIHLGSGGPISYSDIAAGYVLRLGQTTAVATNYLTAALASVGSDVRADTSKHIMGWAGIFDRYTKVVSTDSGKEKLPGTTSSASQSLGNLDL